VLSDNKGVKTTFFRWCGDLLYFLDKGFPWDYVFNRLLKYRSFFELIVDCRFACRFVFNSLSYLVPIFPLTLDDICGDTLLIISMFQMAYKKAPARTPIIPPAVSMVPQALTVSLKSDQFLSLGPEDCEPSVEPEDFGKGGVEVAPEDFGKGGVEVEPEDSGKGGVGVEVESEYDLELRIGGKVGRPGMGHFSLLTVQTVRW